MRHACDERSDRTLRTAPRRVYQQREGQPLAVCLELAKGPIVSALQKYDFFVLFPVNPSTLAKYREAWAPSGKKDDPTDALLALDQAPRQAHGASTPEPEHARAAAVGRRP